MGLTLLTIVAVAFVFTLAIEPKDHAANSRTGGRRASEMTTWVMPTYSHSPIFSPDGRYVWDGEKWVEYPGNGTLIWLLLGLAAGGFLMYLWLS